MNQPRSFFKDDRLLEKSDFSYLPFKHVTGNFHREYGILEDGSHKYNINTWLLQEKGFYFCVTSNQ